MNIQALEKELRSGVENAPKPFRMPDAKGGAIYMLEEFAELLSALHRIERAGDLRGKGDEQKDGIARELAQAVFMTSTTATAIGASLPEMYIRAPAPHPIETAIECISMASRVALHYASGSTSAPAWVVAVLQTIAIEASRLAAALDVDLETEIRVWMGEIREKAHETSG